MPGGAEVVIGGTMPGHEEKSAPKAIIVRLVKKAIDSIPRPICNPDLLSSHCQPAATLSQLRQSPGRECAEPA